MPSDLDAVGYVRSSQYREDVVAYLFEHGNGLPSDMASATGYALPHVSRALGQLRDRELVRLLVSEDRQRGRLYALTAAGERVGRWLSCDFAVDWSVVGADAFRRPQLASFLEDAVGDALRLLACREGGEGELVSYGVPSGNVSPLRARTLFSVPDPDLWAKSGEAYRYAVRGFDGVLALYLVLAGDAHACVTVRADAAVSLPAFVDRCFAALDAADSS